MRHIADANTLMHSFIDTTDLLNSKLNTPSIGDHSPSIDMPQEVTYQLVLLTYSPLALYIFILCTMLMSV